jgi:hypothetical protein
MIERLIELSPSEGALKQRQPNGAPVSPPNAAHLWRTAARIGCHASAKKRSFGSIEPKLLLWSMIDGFGRRIIGRAR